MQTVPDPIELDTILTQQVRRVFAIDDLTWEGKDSLVRYHGHLTMDSQVAYDMLAAALRPYNVTPLFRISQGRETIILISGAIQPQASNLWVNVVMFLLTLLSVLFAGGLYGYQGDLPGNSGMGWGRFILTALRTGLPFAISMLAILLAHEFGHYLAGRYHKTHVTLPYFIPFPFSPFGTMGAFIQMKEPPKNRRVLLDIGMAGPLAGLLVAVPVLFIGLRLSTLDTLPHLITRNTAFSLEGNSLLYLLAKFAVFRQWLPAPHSYNGLAPLTYWLRYFFTGQPLPLGGQDVLLHPVAWAGWAGLLVTALNLIPAGQLDGGHALYVLLGKQVDRIRPLILAILFVLGLVWNGWWLWAFLILIFGGTHAEPLDQITPLDGRRRVLAILGLVVFVLVFTPVPLILVGA
ncbi:MAG: site-2 protease family protein [Anaerolineales bacterium]